MVLIAFLQLEPGIPVTMLTALYSIANFDSSKPFKDNLEKARPPKTLEGLEVESRKLSSLIMKSALALKDPGNAGNEFKKTRFENDKKLINHMNSTLKVLESQTASYKQILEKVRNEVTEHHAIDNVEKALIGRYEAIGGTFTDATITENYPNQPVISSAYITINNKKVDRNNWSSEIASQEARYAAVPRLPGRRSLLSPNELKNARERSSSFASNANGRSRSSSFASNANGRSRSSSSATVANSATGVSNNNNINNTWNGGKRNKRKNRTCRRPTSRTLQSRRAR